MQKNVRVLDTNGKILQTNHPDSVQLKINCIEGTSASFQKIVMILIQKLGISVITINTFFRTNDCIV
jgi:hypothetical protein